MEIPQVDKATIQKGVDLILEGLGLDHHSEGLKDTPSRVANFYCEFFAGKDEDPKASLKLYHADNRDELIIARDISFFSMCEHHLLPFFGKVHLAYIPENNTITGFSRLVHVVEVLSRRPQIQERMTTEIADTLVEVLHPKGVLVVVEAEQLCLTMRGLRQPGIRTISSAVRGALKNEATRQEALTLIKSS
jgi:GTP cyclohydrolase IA